MDARVLIAAALSATALAAVTPVAQATYSPALAVTVRPTNTPGKTIAFTSVVTQASDEEPTKSARVKLPAGFTYDLAGFQRFTACSVPQRDARACPDSSRLGSASANALGQTLSGGVYLGQAAQIYIFLNNATLRLLGQEPKPIVARTEFRPDGGADTVLDELPSDFTATRFELALDGPPKSLLAAPTTCGPFTFTGEFTSRNGVKATSRASVTITDCPPPTVAITSARLSPRRLRRGRSALITYTINRAADMEITVRRAGRARILGRKRFAHPADRRAGRVRVGTRGLSPGRFVVRLRASAGGQASSRSFLLTVRR